MTRDDQDLPRVGDTVRLSDMREGVVTNVFDGAIVVRESPTRWHTFRLDEIEHRRLDA